MNKVVDIFAGGWELSGTSRMQIQNLRADGIRLVGMGKEELQKEFKIRITSNPTTGATIVLNAPDDIILNTRRAFSTDPTSATGYSALGVPEGRYITRASREGCIALYPGDCDTPDQIVINGPWFVRFDLRAHQARADQGTVDGGVQHRVHEPVRQHQLQPGLQPRRRHRRSSR